VRCLHPLLAILVLQARPDLTQEVDQDLAGNRRRDILELGHQAVTRRLGNAGGGSLLLLSAVLLGGAGIIAVLGVFPARPEIKAHASGPTEQALRRLAASLPASAGSATDPRGYAENHSCTGATGVPDFDGDSVNHRIMQLGYQQLDSQAGLATLDQWARALGLQRVDPEPPISLGETQYLRNADGIRIGDCGSGLGRLATLGVHRAPLPDRRRLRPDQPGRGRADLQLPERPLTPAGRCGRASWPGCLAGRPGRWPASQLRR
jgi:hypothetical protein